MRRAGWLALCLSLFAVRAGGEISEARYLEPTTRYDHGVLGDAVEWGALELIAKGRRLLIRLPETRVFEDVAPRVLPGGEAVAVVESDLARGARLALYDAGGLVDATPFIGRAHRWLAPLGAADLDGDGIIEIAYIDRPHLAKVLRIWRFEAGRLSHLADVAGLTNHRIGWDRIPGGIRACGGAPEMITASGDWAHVMATRWDGSRAISRRISAYDGPESLIRALACN